MNKNRIIITMLIGLLLLLPINVFAVTYGKVGESTNFNGDVNIPSGSQYYINEVAMRFVQCLSNGTTAPTVNDDSDDGYSVNSIWTDITNDKSYICVDSTVGAAVWIEITEAGYTNLTSFVDQTAWRVFYSNADGDVIELALGTDGQYFKSTGATSVPIFDTPAGGGDVLGPVTSVDHSITRFNGTDNKTIQDSLATIDDAGSINIPTGQTYKINGTALAVGNITGAAASGANSDITSMTGLTTPLGAAYGGTGIANAAGETITLVGDDAITFTTTATTDVTLPITGTLMANLSEDTTPQAGGNVDMQQFYILIDDALGTDHDYSGIVDSANVGETVVFGELLYYDWTAVEWKKAKADIVGTTPAMRIALEGKDDGQACLMLVQGYIRDDSAFDFGASRVFLNDDVAGTCDDTAPAESGDQIQMVGIAISADKMFFCPSIDVGEI